MLRHACIAALMLAACQPDIAQTPPASFVTAVFDPTTSQVPLPNDLVFFNPPNSVCPPPADPNATAPACAQAELLTAFGGQFPSDQELAVTIDFQQTDFGSDNTPTLTAPDLDFTSFNPMTFFVVGETNTDTGEVEMEPVTAADYVKGTDRGTLSLHRKGHLPWAEGSYSVLVRGGPNGIKAKGSVPVVASQVFDLVAQGLDMTDPANIGLLKAQTGSTEAAIEQGRQLNLLIALYQMHAFPTADTRFPHQELAITTTFRIAPVVTNVTIDPARGLVPLPIDLLRDAKTGHLTPLAACTLAGSSLQADGSCPSAAAGGFEALDGFATTGAILGPTSELVDASTITPATLQLYDLTDPAHPALVDPTGLILEPCEFTAGCGSATPLSPVIAIQPSGATAGDPTSVFRTRPLKDATDYAVVMTTGIKDKAGDSIGPGTVAKIVRFVNPIVDASGHSGLSGIDDATAASLEKMRGQLGPVFATLAAAGTPSSEVAMAYTFHTQTILSQAVQLGALPYTLPPASALPDGTTLVADMASNVFAKYGVDKAIVPFGNIDEIIEVDMQGFNALDQVTGAFLSDPTMGVLETQHVMIATPKLANVPKACPGALAGLACSPMMIFRHGFQGGRAQMLTVADRFTAAGLTVVAIDAAKHGDRAFCTSGSVGQCKDPNEMCVTILPSGAQGDANPPGTCLTSGFLKHPVSSTCTGACASAALDGIPFVSGNYLVSTNFFRTRDTLRQDFIDESQMVRAIAFIPDGVTHNAVFDHMSGRGVIIDPANVYYSGQSLGAIQGVADVATNPRISRAGFNVGGGTVVDVFTNSPAFADQTLALLASLGVEPGTAKFLQFLVVAKTVLDPADPVNFAGHLTANTLPNLLVDPTGHTPQDVKTVLSQIANCDNTVPNPFNLILSANVPTGPLPTGASFFAPGGTGTFQLFVTAPFNPATFGSCSASVVEHGFLTDWKTQLLTQNAQDDIANFVMANTLPLRVQHQ
ncbi:MAG TPA: hypothetical protein VGO00_14765 [Kofleriaceae bacterium]|nr:hypothetical protein [Kofleriaceae bacterium]